MYRRSPVLLYPGSFFVKPRLYVPHINPTGFNPISSVEAYAAKKSASESHRHFDEMRAQNRTTDKVMLHAAVGVDRTLPRSGDLSERYSTRATHRIPGADEVRRDFYPLESRGTARGSTPVKLPSSQERARLGYSEEDAPYQDRVINTAPVTFKGPVQPIIYRPSELKVLESTKEILTDFHQTNSIAGKFVSPPNLSSIHNEDMISFFAKKDSSFLDVWAIKDPNGPGFLSRDQYCKRYYKEATGLLDDTRIAVAEGNVDALRTLNGRLTEIFDQINKDRYSSWFPAEEIDSLT